MKAAAPSLTERKARLPNPLTQPRNKPKIWHGTSTPCRLLCYQNQCRSQLALVLQVEANKMYHREPMLAREIVHHLGSVDRNSGDVISRAVPYFYCCIREVKYVTAAHCHGATKAELEPLIPIYTPFPCLRTNTA